MYNLLEYCKNYRTITGSLWNYYRNEPSNTLCSNSESFKYKTSITGNNYDLDVGEFGYVANKVGKKWILNCCTIKTSKQLENFEYNID